MPRLTNPHYLTNRNRLAHLWQAHTLLFARALTSCEQWDLHDYYTPALTDLTPEAALAHRQLAQQHDPSLPQRAGRALKKLDTAIEAIRAGVPHHPAAPTPPPPTKKTNSSGRRRGKRQVLATVLVKPQIDTELLSKALLKAANDLAQRDHDEDPGQDDSAGSSAA